MGITRKSESAFGKGTFYRFKFTPDSTQLVVETAIGVWLYDANTGEEIALFPEDGKTLAISGADGTILLLDWNGVLNELENK